MENQDFNKELLDYIYGEMSTNEKKEFEIKLNNDSVLQNEYKELTEVRDVLENLKDKEVMEPFSAWAKQRSSYWYNTGQKRRRVVFRPITAVAASLIILMLVGYLTNFSISINDNGFQASFGVQSMDQAQYLSAEEVKSLVSREVAQSRNELLTQIAQNQERSDNKFTVMEASIIAAKKTEARVPVTNEDLQNFFVNVENKNAETMKEYMKLTSNQQQEYFKTILTQFNDFYQKQRNDDLTFVQTSLLEMQQNQSSQKQETEKAIASIITSVSQRNN